MNKQIQNKNRPHVLVIDDDTEIVDCIATTLKARGMKVSTACDGNQGIAYAETKSPELVILDLMMPRRSGFLVLEHLRQNSETQMPIIMITGNEGMRHKKYAELLGVNDYIQKPFTMDRLLQAVSNVLDAEPS